MLSLQQAEEPRLKPTFRLDLLEARVAGGAPAAVRLRVYEIAALAVHAEPLAEEDPAFLGLVLGVELLVLAELVRAVRELALLLVRTEPEFHEFLAELRFFLILLYGRFGRHGREALAGRGGVLRRGGEAGLLRLERLEAAGDGEVEDSAGIHANLICKLF